MGLLAVSGAVVIWFAATLAAHGMDFLRSIVLGTFIIAVSFALAVISQKVL